MRVQIWALKSCPYSVQAVRTVEAFQKELRERGMQAGLTLEPAVWVERDEGAKEQARAQSGTDHPTFPIVLVDGQLRSEGSEGLAEDLCSRLTLPAPFQDDVKLVVVATIKDTVARTPMEQRRLGRIGPIDRSIDTTIQSMLRDGPFAQRSSKRSSKRSRPKRRRHDRRHDRR